MSRTTTRRTRTVRTTAYTYTAPYWMLQLSFWLVVLIGAAMAVTGILHVAHVTAFDAAAAWIESVCTAIALIIPIILSYRIARQKSTAWLICWVVFVVLIVLGIILARIPV